MNASQETFYLQVINEKRDPVHLRNWFTEEKDYLITWAGAGEAAAAAPVFIRFIRVHPCPSFILGVKWGETHKLFSGVSQWLISSDCVSNESLAPCDCYSLASVSLDSLFFSFNRPFHLTFFCSVSHCERTELSSERCHCNRSKATYFPWHFFARNHTSIGHL